MKKLVDDHSDAGEADTHANFHISVFHPGLLYCK